jgi:hypothetical protein
MKIFKDGEYSYTGLSDSEKKKIARYAAKFYSRAKQDRLRAAIRNGEVEQKIVVREGILEQPLTTEETILVENITTSPIVINAEQTDTISSPTENKLPNLAFYNKLWEEFNKVPFQADQL